MSNKKLTAVETLNRELNPIIEKLSYKGYKNNYEFIEDYLRVFYKAAEMEKKQIIDAYKDGRLYQQSKFKIFYNRKSQEYYIDNYEIE